MTHASRTTPRRRLAPAILVAIGVGCAVGGTGSVAQAQEAPQAKAAESARDAVDRLLADFMSDDAATRERAEKAVVALGEPARAELDRLTRDTDPQKAIAALKLLQSPEWERRARREREARRDEAPRTPRLPDIDLRRFQDDFERQMEEFRRSLDAWRQQFDTGDWMPGFETRGGTPSESENSRGASSGQVVENDRSLAWTIDDAGKVKVTVRDGKDAAEQVFEAPSLAELRKQHPDVAKRLDGFLPSGGLRRWTLVWPPRASWDDTGAKDRTAPETRDPALRDGEQKLAPESRDAPSPPPTGPAEIAVPGPVLGITWGDVPDVLRDQCELPEGGMVVQSVSPGSIASALGLRRNDVLLKLGGRDVSGPSGVRRALESVAVGSPLTAEILRKGRRETLTGTR